MPQESEQVCRSFHECVDAAYTITHKWLDKQVEANGYKNLKYEQIKDRLEEESMLSAAAQFHAYFPGHYFKVIHTLEEVVGQQRLINWLQHNPRICIVDIGCGAGAGTVAFVEMLLRLQESGQIGNPIDIFCLGIDPNAYAVALYERFLSQIQGQLHLSKINLDYDCEFEGIPNSTNWITRRLDRKREDWNQPRLAHVVVMQINVVSPLSKDHKKRQEKLAIRKKFNKNATSSPDSDEQFGEQQAQAYKSVFETVAIDNMHVLTVGTNNYMLDERVREMGQALNRIFSSSQHRTELLGEGARQVIYRNPPYGRYGWNKDPYPSDQFHIHIISITNEEFRSDKDWQEVISEENLQVAWAKTRFSLLRESFVDQVEIRLFESDLDENLSRMRQQLMAYAEELRRTDDYIAYKVPKDAAKVRPRGLSRMEEELLAVAIIQKLGNKESQLRGSSYAYRVKPKSKGRDTEYLYEYWLYTHRKFLDEAREEAKKYPGGAVIRADIKSFYTRIIQDQLIELTTRTLTKSERIQWLIKLLLSKNLDEHEVGRGISQGGIGSGFYANIYLTAIDTLFGAENEWDVKFYRYVDDMIFVVPEPKDGRNIRVVVEEIQQALKGELDKLGLELNEGKDELYYNISDFIQKTVANPIIVQITEQFEQVMNALWILNEDGRTRFIKYFDQDEAWWYYIEQYRQCLKLLSIYTSTTLMSRRISKYFFSESKRRKDLKRKKELIFQELPNKRGFENLKNWAEAFAKQNTDWIADKEKLHSQVVELFLSTWTELKSPGPIDSYHERQLETGVRFAISKLCLLGFNQVSEAIVELLLERPWLIRDPVRVLESLAYQGFAVELLTLFNSYENDSHPMHEYLRATLLRAIRFLPEVRNKHWAILTQYATRGSISERLMATETWLYLHDTPGFATHGIYVGEIEKALKNVLLPTRLLKNYILLISLCNSKSADQIQMDNDPMLHNVFNVISEGEISELFEYQEPSLIREKFYGGQQEGQVEQDQPY